MENIVLAGGVRTPIGAFQGAFADISAVDLGAAAVREALKRSGVKPEDVDEVLMGCILQGGLGQNPARQILLKAGIPKEVTGTTINMVCGSGLRTIIDAARMIKLGEADVVVAGGIESMTRAPYFLDKARTGFRMGNGEIFDMMIHDGLTCIITNVHMGVTAENIVAKYGFTKEEQDKFAYESQMKAAKAIEKDIFKDEIVPVSIPQRKGDPIVVSKDEHPKPSTTLEGLARVRAAFKKDGSVSAGNASGINDGAAAIVVLSEKKAKELGVTPQAKIMDYAYAGVDPSIMGTGPIEAVKKLFKKTGKTLDDIDLIEANEAFAAQAMSVARDLGWDKSPHSEKVNVNGGAIALGHPIGASGCRIVVTLIHEMMRRNVKRGLATLCQGGGMGIAMMVER